ncbi:TPA_asm: hypothetical protein [Tilapia adomavirus 1]|uniref:Uncharacterized protein n=1 Tax=Tilapia adomavirus 1 TaxID=2597803 RepID=A0A5H3CQG8_9VIRU|nr:TPA_asm: hypothetical protein [Tilapia adomavirus 1]
MPPKKTQINYPATPLSRRNAKKAKQTHQIKSMKSYRAKLQHLRKRNAKGHFSYLLPRKLLLKSPSKSLCMVFRYCCEIRGHSQLTVFFPAFFLFLFFF